MENMILNGEPLTTREQKIMEVYGIINALLGRAFYEAYPENVHRLLEFRRLKSRLEDQFEDLDADQIEIALLIMTALEKLAVGGFVED